VTKKILLTVAAIITVILLCIGGFYLKVALSGPIGQGQGEINKNQASNWTAKQAEFERLYESIQTQDRRLNNAADVLAKSPGDKTYQQTYSGIQSGCEGLVGDYNSLSNEFMAADFKDSRLPYKIDTTDPAFDCKEDTK